MALDTSAIIDIVLLLGACILTILMFYSKRYPRVLLSFAGIVTCLLLFCVHRLALIIGFILFWCYIGPIIAYAMCFLNMVGSTETAGRVKSSIVVLVIYLALSVLIVFLIPSQELSAPVQILASDLGKGLWSVNVFITLLLSLLVFVSIATMLIITRFSMESK